MSRGHTEKMYSLFGHEKVFLLQRKSVKTLSDKIYGSLNLLLDTYASNICPIKCGAMPMSLGNTFSQDVPIGCPGTSPLDVLGHPYVMSWDISM